MAYVTGQETSLDNIRIALASFAQAQGWTIHFSGARPAGLSGTALIVSKNGLAPTTFFFTPSDTQYQIYIYGHDPYTGAGSQPSESTTNRSKAITVNRISTTFPSYYFFAGDTYLYVVLETTIGEFRHFGCGMLNTFGDVGGGHFVCGNIWQTGTNQTNPSQNSWGLYSAAVSDLRATYYGQTNIWSGTASNMLDFFPNEGASSTTSNTPVIAATSAYTLRPIMSSVIWRARATSSSTTYTPYGIAPNWRIVPLGNLNPKETIALGNDTWLVFPVLRKAASAGVPDSRLIGYAYKT